MFVVLHLKILGLYHDYVRSTIITLLSNVLGCPETWTSQSIARLEIRILGTKG